MAHASSGSVQLVNYPVEKLTDNSVTDFDVFVNLSNHVILYGASGYKWYRRELTELLHSGVKHFLIRRADVGKAEVYEKLTKLSQVPKDMPPRDRLLTLEKIGAEFTRLLHAGEITEACVKKGEMIAQDIVECIAEDNRCIQVISGLGNHDYYTYVHSVRVASYSVAIAIEMGLTDKDRLRDIAVGCLFHDVGKKDVPVAVINKAGVLTEEEWKLLRAHPEYGFKSVQDLVFPHVPKEIILHHHEKNDGSGYPHGLDKTSLLPEVQIATLADVFDALTSTRSYQTKRTRYEALDFIRHQMLGPKISKDPYQALISCLVSDPKAA